MISADTDFGTILAIRKQTAPSVILFRHGMSELALDDRQRNPFVRHLDCMSMPELVRREAPPHPACAARRRAHRALRSLTPRC